jgi:hypothetical protein
VVDVSPVVDDPPLNLTSGAQPTAGA